MQPAPTTVTHLQSFVLPAVDGLRQDAPAQITKVSISVVRLSIVNRGDLSKIWSDALARPPDIEIRDTRGLVLAGSSTVEVLKAEIAEQLSQLAHPAWCALLKQCSRGAVGVARAHEFYKRSTLMHISGKLIADCMTLDGAGITSSARLMLGLDDEPEDAGDGVDRGWLKPGGDAGALGGHRTYAPRGAAAKGGRCALREAPSDRDPMAISKAHPTTKIP